MIVAFAGSIGRFPVGGHAWVDMQYLLGLRDLGCDVYYLEECGEGSWVYNWETEELVTDLDYPTSYVKSCLDPIGFGHRWAYRAGDACVGMSVDDLRDICHEADLLIIRACPIDVWREEYCWPRRRIFVDSDPGFTQFKLNGGHSTLQLTIDNCDRLFTAGGRIGSDDCPIPTLGREWVPLPPPVYLPEWPMASNDDPTHFTSVMQWRSYDDIVHDGVRYGNKDVEFPKFIDLPQRTSQPFQMAATGVLPETLADYGWEVVTGWKVVWSPESYREFVQQSRAEFGVAKHGYVATRGGWVSDRSCCYLASGRPVLVQDTGQSDWLPIGDGFLTFRDQRQALSGLDSINADYPKHCKAARKLAEEHFSADRVLSRMLEISVGCA